MSRAERRAYQRMTKNQDPRALPVNAGQKARAERIAQRRAASRGTTAPRPGRTYWIRALVVAVLLGVVAFSIAWPNGMPVALYVGLAAVAVALVAAFGLRTVLSRAAGAARQAAARDPRGG